MAHGVDRDFHTAAFNAANHRDIESELADQGLDFAQHVGAVAQSNHHDMGAAQSQRQVTQGGYGVQCQPGLTQLGTLLIIKRAERIQPDSLQYVWSRSVHNGQPVTKV
jgi:hypothetical protein